MRSRGVRVGVLAMAAVTGTAGLVGACGAVQAAETTPEEARLARPVPQEILKTSGFDRTAFDFAHSLADVRSYKGAQQVVKRHGRLLWTRAVNRAQGRGPADGLSRNDDRPLYWTRLRMTRGLREWDPSFALTGKQRERLLGTLEKTSRGQDTIRFPKGHGVKRILVTGFDPFTLDRDVRISNPSGATALALDGTLIDTADGPARIETAMFPVRWTDFAEGMVERTLRPVLPKVDMFTTVSQGRPGRFDVERYNGAWRGGTLDNENVSRLETIPVDDPTTQPQWTSTTLPHAAIVAANTGRFRVVDNTEVTEIPAGGTQEVVRPDGPTPGSTARQGAGGNYLSNEIAYRATLLRDRLGLHDTLPGGHVHTPVLQFGTGNTDPASGTVTDPQFLQNRQDIITQVRAILTVAVNATSAG
jgi:pyrrolidone-carboxylate peptidase